MSWFETHANNQRTAYGGSQKRIFIDRANLQKLVDSGSMTKKEMREYIKRKK